MAGWDDHEDIEATIPSVSGGLLDVIAGDYGPVWGSSIGIWRFNILSWGIWCIPWVGAR